MLQPLFTPTRAIFALHDVETVQLQQDYEGVLAGEKDVHVADDLVVDYEDEAEREEWAVLKTQGFDQCIFFFY